MKKIRGLGQRVDIWGWGWNTQLPMFSSFKLLVLFGLHKTVCGDFLPFDTFDFDFSDLSKKSSLWTIQS